MLESAVKSVRRCPWLLPFTGLSDHPALVTLPPLSRPPPSVCAVSFPVSQDSARACLSTYFQGLPVKFLAIVLLILTGAHPQRSSAVGFPHLFPFKFVTFS